jgi:hypothetical protein
MRPFWILHSGIADRNQGLAIQNPKSKIQNRFIPLFVILVGAATAALHETVPAVQRPAEPAAVVIPFELVTRHILIKVRINNSDPLWFIFDTGDKVAIIDLERAKSLGLNLQGEVNVGGAGPGTLRGSHVRDAFLSVVGLEGSRQPVVMAVPLQSMQSKFGHDIDGIIGGDFIKQFVVEVDYPARVLRLHDKDKFAYSGSGEIIPINLNSGGHPFISAEVTVTGRPAMKGKFLIDLGSGASLALHSPFVEQQGLLQTTQKTIKSLGGGGAGGRVAGRTGRIVELRIGKFQIENPLTLFSQDKAGAFASSESQGNIGQQILSKFTVLLDYGRDRIILEPNASFKDPIVPALSGLRLVAEGADYKTFRVEELIEDSPATEAGIQKDDIILMVDQLPTSGTTLSTLIEALNRPVPHKLSVSRAGKTLQLTLTPRRLI